MFNINSVAQAFIEQAVQKTESDNIIDQGQKANNIMDKKISQTEKNMQLFQEAAKKSGGGGLFGGLFGGIFKMLTGLVKKAVTVFASKFGPLGTMVAQFINKAIDKLASQIKLGGGSSESEKPNFKEIFDSIKQNQDQKPSFKEIIEAAENGNLDELRNSNRYIAA